jgi:transposase
MGLLPTAWNFFDLDETIPYLPTLTFSDVVLADKGYDTDAIVEHVHVMDADAVMPPKQNRKQQREYDKALYKQRNRIERCFSRLKHFRSFATRKGLVSC